jgi:hypothetical protein
MITQLYYSVKAAINFTTGMTSDVMNDSRAHKQELTPHELAATPRPIIFCTSSYSDSWTNGMIVPVMANAQECVTHCEG